MANRYSVPLEYLVIYHRYLEKKFYQFFEWGVGSHLEAENDLPNFKKLGTQFKQRQNQTRDPKIYFQTRQCYITWILTAANVIKNTV
jgi:hypothetical protein